MRAQRPQGVHGIRDAGTIDLEPARIEGGVGRGGENRHGVPVLGIRDLSVLLERRGPRRHKQHEVEPKRLASLLGDGQVPVVDRVERPSHDPEPHASTGNGI